MNHPPPSIDESPSHRAYWTFQLTGWALFTAARFVGGLAVLGLQWTDIALQLLLLDGVGLGVSHGLRHYARRHQWRALPIRSLVGKVVGASLIVAVPMGILTQFTELSALNDPTPELQRFAPSLLIRFSWPVATGVEILNWAVVFGIWFMLYFSIVGVREYRSAQLEQSELARALHLAELRLLKSQLNPHFLFNALNTVRSLMTDDPARAQVAISRLATTLRYSLGSRQEEMVTLSQELAIVADYLELESMRFEDRLRIEYQVSEAAAAVQIPVMLLQTLVENSIKHGIAELPEGGVLRISAVLQDEMLVLDVENPRPLNLLASSREGVGLRNAHDRLRLLFDGRATLVLDLSRPRVATAQLRIPARA